MSKERTVITSPAGILRMGFITKPSTKFKAEGEYTAIIALDPEAKGVSELKAQLEAAAKASLASALKDAKDGKAKKAIEGCELHTPLNSEVDNDGNDTGLLVLKAANKAVMKKKDGETFEKKIALFDAKGKPITLPPKIGKGTKCKLAFIIAPFCMVATKKVGVTLWLEAVQIIDLVEYGGGDAASYGFGEEDGYEASNDAGSAEGESSSTSSETPATDSEKQGQF
jgi:hypothetical protein